VLLFLLLCRAALSTRSSADSAGRGDGHGRHGLQPDPRHHVTSHDPSALDSPAPQGQLSECAETEIVFETFFAPAGHTVYVCVVVPEPQLKGRSSEPLAG
jgi:hypothetical protein